MKHVQTDNRRTHHTPGPQQSGRGAFTLIELLVVLSIVSLLLAILLPALQQARAAAYATQCLVNLRQIAMGIEIYANDNGGYHPPRYNNYTSGFPDVIMATLQLTPFSHASSYNAPGGHEAKRYYYNNGGAVIADFHELPASVQQQTIFHCPGALLSSQGPVEVYTGSYASNQALTGSRSGPFFGRQLYNSDYTSGVPEPAKTLSVVCSGGASIADNREIYIQTSAGYPVGWVGQRRRDGAYMKHLGATNAAFLDGHVAATAPNPAQPITWESFNLDEWKLLDINLIIHPGARGPRLTPGWSVAP